MLFSSPNNVATEFAAATITLADDVQTNLPLIEQLSLGFAAYFNCTQLFC